MEEDRVKYETLIQAIDEISSLKTALSEKTSTLHHLISTHETLKTTSKAEIAKLESENRNLISALDEANSSKDERENKISVFQEEIQRLRSLLEESQKKIKQIEESAQKGKEVRKREELLVSYEEEREKLKEKLKWKSEQFSHLEEAHRKSQLELKQFRKETEKEKSEFVIKIAELETNLESKSRFLEDFKSRLEMCNQALASEESKRKLLQAELREIQERYNCVVTDFEAARLAIESVTQQRDADVASLRGILADKSLQIKEIEFEKAQLERENKELRDEVKELREVQIRGIEKSKKFKALEKRIRVRDSEIEGLKRELDDCLVKLNEKGVDCLDFGRVVHEECEGKIRVRDLEIENLKRELDDCFGKLNSKDGDCLNLEGGIIHEECEGEIRLRDSEIENLKWELNDCLVKLNERDGLVEKIRVRDLEIENLKNDLEDCLFKLNERDGLVDKIKVKDLEIKNLKKDLDECLVKVNERDSLVEKIRVQGLEIENLKKNLEDCLVTLNERDGLVDKIEFKDLEIENLKKDLDECLVKLHERDGLVEKIRVQYLEIENLKNDLDACLVKLNEGDELVENIRVTEAEIENLKKDLNDNEKNVEKIRIQESQIENLKSDLNDCLDRLSNKDKLVEKLRSELETHYSNLEEENMVKKEELSVAFLVIKGNYEGHFEKCQKDIHEMSVKSEEENILKKQIEELICQVKERNEMIEGLIKYLEREKAVVRENESLVSELRENIRVVKDRELDLERENENLLSLVTDLKAEIEEMKDERKRYTELENEISKKLLEIKYKLDPLEGKYKEFSFELEENLYSLVEALGNSNSEVELLQLELHEMVSNYFLQEFEIQVRNYIISKMEMDSEVERVEADENREMKYLNEIDDLRMEKENLELKMLDLNCGISSLFCADGEIKSILENVSHKLKFEDDMSKINSPLRNKAFVPVFGLRSPFKGKENNF